MKHYYTNYDELCRAWVKGEVDGEVYTAKRRMYGDLNAIYSYGSHFCIARRWQAVGRTKSWFLLTERRYSNTTETHKRAVYSNLSRHNTIMLPQVDNLHEYGLVNGTDEDLAAVLFKTECDRLDNYLSKYMKMLRPHDPTYLRGRLEETRESLARLGLELPESLRLKYVQARDHCHTRAARNEVLDATAHARRRLLAA